MKKRRIIFVGVMIIVGFATVIARLAYIQLIGTEHFSKRNINLIEKSVSQRVQTFVLSDGRGIFVDRNNQPISGKGQQRIIFFPFLEKMTWPIEKVATILDVSKTMIQEQLKQNESPFVLKEKEVALVLTKEQVTEINDLHIPGVIATSVHLEEEDEPLTDHVIGIVSENEQLFRQLYPDKENVQLPLVGVSGLQQTFDEFIQSDGESKLVFHVDNLGGALLGDKIKYAEPANPFYPVTVQTTLDKNLQEIGEEILTSYGVKKGGLVLLDVQSNEILAMVSKPSLSTASSVSYKETIENQMLKRHVPGSVFKIVIAAAALENIPDAATRTYNCNVSIYNELLEKEKQLGTISFQESFAKSCNHTFATLGNELIDKSPTIFEEYAKKLGLGETVGWKGTLFHEQNFEQLPEEEKTIIWRDENEKSVSRAVSQTAIGQKDVQLSPLAIANMMATIARNGEKQEVKIVRQIAYKNNVAMLSFPTHELEEETLRPEIVKQLQEDMRAVVANNGTGSFLNDLPYQVAGKSGTAELTKGEEAVNKWFAGYFPYENPKYALVVVDLETTNRSNTIHIFHDYVKKVYECNQNLK